jgi:hypothetical protein
MILEISKDERRILMRGLLQLSHEEGNPLLDRLMELREVSTERAENPQAETSKSDAAKPVTPPDRPPAPTPAPKSTSLVNEPIGPLIEEVEVEMKVGTGRNEHYESVRLMQVEGLVSSVSALQVSAKKSQFITIEIAGLPNEPESKTITPHAQFHCFHKSLFDAILTAKPGKSRITFQYKTTTVANDPKKLIWQNIEGVSQVDGAQFQEGKPVTASQSTQPSPGIGD